MTQRGITLIELLVVVAILGVATSVVVFNAPPIRPPAREEAEKFAARLERAADEAIISGAAYRLETREGGYAFARREDDAWVVETDATMPLRPEVVVLTIDVEDAAADNALALNGGAPPTSDENEEGVTYLPIEPFGLTPAFTASFQSRRGVWNVFSTADGAVRLEQR